jgi:SAM-dependent methyltransferase
MESPVTVGSAVYSAPLLAFYNAGVLIFNNRYVWRCPRERLLQHYDKHISCHHLDIGPGTGWYLEHSTFPCDDPDVTLLDLNTGSLQKTAAKLRTIRPKILQANVFDPIAGQFDSIAANYVLHCLPGGWRQKSPAISHIAQALSPTGTFFGSTIISEGAQHNSLARMTMTLYNAVGIFHNKGDDLAGLQTLLDDNFERTTIEIIGSVAVFSAANPRRWP